MIAIFCNNNSAGYKKRGRSAFLQCATSSHNSSLFSTKRNVFANPPAPSGGTEGASKELTIDDLSDKFLELMDKRVLPEKLVDQALKVVETGSDAAKQKLLDAVQSFSESKMGEGTLRGIVKREIKAAGLQPAAATEPGKTPEAAKAPEEGKGAEAAAKFDKEVSGIQGGVSKQIEAALQAAERMGEQAKIPEKQEKVNKVITSLKSAQKKDLERGQKVKSLLGKFVSEQKLTPDQAKSLYNLNLDINALLDGFEAKGKLTKEEKEQVFRASFPPQDSEAKTIQKAFFDGMIAKGKLTDADVKSIMAVGKNSRDYEKLLDELTSSDEFKELRKDKKALDELKQLKIAEAKSEEEFAKTLKSLREVMKEMSDDVTVLAEREKAIQNLSLAAGVPVKKGQVLTYMQFTEGKEKGFQYIKRPATIKDIYFAPKESKADDDGQVYTVSPSHVPVVVVDAYDPATNSMKEEHFGYSQFLKWIDRQSVTEDLKSKKEMEASIQETVNEGDTFEYRFITDVAEKKADDVQVKVEKVFEGEDEHGMKTTMIELDKEVIVAPTSSAKRKTVSIGEFAKWFKRSEVMKSIDSVENLRKALVTHNEEINKRYPDRNPKHYPPIAIVRDEILKYDDGSGRTFVIKEVSDKGIILDDGNIFSFASFLRWVKKNEVEKVNAEGEAEAETAFIEDPKEKEEAKAKLLAEKAVKNAKRLHDAHHGKGHEHGHGHGHSEDPSQFSSSYLRQLWNDTQFITPHNLLEMGKTIWEFIKRKLHRREHGAIGVVGEQMFGPLWTELGAEFKGVAQHAENEEVEHHAKHYRTMGIETVLHELHAAPNKDILKAAITVLCEKGQMRWDDPEFHKALNKLANGSPCWVRKATHLEDIEKILDGWFGNDTFREFRNKQESGYNGIKKNFEDRAKRLEADPEQNGGLRFALQNLLFKHLRGEYVNPAEYEEYLHFAIGAGKLSFEDKLFYLIMGIGAPGKGHGGHPGQTLLHIDRVGAIESELLRNFPILDFFTSASFPKYDANGDPVYKKDAHGHPMKDPVTGEPEVEMGKITIRHFEEWVHDIMHHDLGVSDANEIHDVKQLKPDTGYTFVGKMLREKIAWNEAARQRISKASGNPSNWDHDDMDVFGPMLGEEAVFNLLARQGGATQQVTNEGIKNIYVGFNNFTKIKMDMMKNHLKDGSKGLAQKDIRDLTNLLRSFVRFDAICDDRYNHGQTNQVRFGDQEFYSIPIADGSRYVKKHQQEMHAFLGSLAKELKLTKEWNIVTKKMGKAPPKNKADEQQATVGDFGAKLEGALNELDQQALADLFTKIQGENAKKNLDVKGTLEKPKSKSEGEKITAEMYQLQTYVNAELLGKVEQIRELQEEANIQPLTDAEKAGRIQKIIALVEAEKFTELDAKKDGKLLDEEIGRLQAQLGQKKSSKPAGARKQ